MKRPSFLVFTNLAISLDGKIASRDRGHLDPAPRDRELMDRHRARADAVLMGAGTLRAFRRASKIKSPRLISRRLRSRMRPQPLNVVLARRLDFDPSWPFFRDPSIERVLVVPEGTPARRLARFRKTARIFLYEPSRTLPAQVVAYLQDIGCRSLLLEGGGGVMFPWVESDLVDEWNVTVSPIVIGGGQAPTMVDGEGFATGSFRGYKLAMCERRGDQVFLQYVRGRR